MTIRVRRVLTLGAGLAALGLMSGGALARDRTTHARKGSLEQRMARLEREVALRAPDVSTFELPEKLTFCGKAVDLSRPETRERLEREFYLVLGDRAQVVLWTKRARRVFPIVEAQAKAMGSCADLKYVAVLESGLRPAVTSRASAVGWWQFMADTGKDYGLHVNRTWDQRADLNDATRAGLTYLERLHEQFGSWELALAAYNTGPGRLKRAQKSQGLTDFWSLDLYDEAERYVPRAIAIMTVLDDLEAYGFHMSVEKDGWAPEARGFVKVTVPAGHEIPVADVARGAGVPLRDIRRLNPELRTEVLPTGREVVMEVPLGKERVLRGWIEDAVAQGKAAQVAPTAKGRSGRKDARAASRGKKSSGARKGIASPVKSSAKGRASKSRGAAKKSRKTHRVRPGESLWGIANQHGITVAQLRSWNAMGRRSVLHPGQRLVVRR